MFGLIFVILGLVLFIALCLLGYTADSRDPRFSVGSLLGPDTGSPLSNGQRSDKP
jgi:hypothetical protein